METVLTLLMFVFGAIAMLATTVMAVAALPMVIDDSIESLGRLSRLFSKKEK